MSFNHDCSYEKNQPLGLLLCLLVIVYIYYFTIAQPQSPQSPEQIQDAIPTPVTGIQIEDDLTSNAKLLNAFEAGTKAYMQFDVQDIRQMKLQMEEWNHESKEREKRMEKRLGEFEECKAETERQMKKWREEQLRMIWDGKQKREGLGSWFKFGSPRVTESVAMNEGWKERRDSHVKEKFDEKKG